MCWSRHRDWYKIGLYEEVWLNDFQIGRVVGRCEKVRKRGEDRRIELDVLFPRLIERNDLVAWYMRTQAQLNVGTTRVYRLGSLRTQHYFHPFTPLISSLFLPPPRSLIQQRLAGYLLGFFSTLMPRLHQSFITLHLLPFYMINLTSSIRPPTSRLRNSNSTRNYYIKHVM